MGRHRSRSRSVERRRDERRTHRRHDEERYRRDTSSDRYERRKRSASRDRLDERYDRRRRSRSSSRDRYKRSRSPHDRRSEKTKDYSRQDVITIDGEEDDTHLTEEERMMKQMMGFGQFNTTKGKKVQADIGEAHVVTKRKYRQYMNRRGGFNRPLDAVE